MAQKWNLQDIVPPDRAPRRASRPVSVAQRGAPPRDMRERGSGEREPQRPTFERGSTRVPLHTSDRREPVQPSRTREIPRETAPQTDEYPEETYETPTPRDPLDSVVSRLEITDGHLARIRKYIFAAVACAIIGFAGITATIMLSGADVTVKPKAFATTVQASFEAQLKPEVGELGYELLTLEEEGERQVAAKGKEEVNTKTEGTIAVFNGFSATPQKLVKNTRFEAPGGLIYRIADGISIPGYKKDASGGVTPGMVKAKVIADGTGANYNIADVRLSVPGLKGSDQFDAIYATTDKAGLTGGFSGTKFVIDETELATTKQKLHTELRDKLLARIATERPNGFVVFDPAITFVYDSLPSAGAGDQAAVIKERARLFVPLFNEVAFASFIAKSAVPSYGGEPVRIENPSALAFAYEGSPLADISKEDTIAFTLSGNAKIIWKYDQDALKKDLIGAPQSTLPAVWAKYPAIEKAAVKIHPIWKRSFPQDPKRVKITEVMDMP